MLTSLGIAALAITLIIVAAATEVAVFAVPAARIQELEEEGRRGVRGLKALRSRPAGLLAGLWIVRVVGIGTALWAAWNVPTLRPPGLVLALALTGIAIIFAEFAGKALGLKIGEALSLRLVWPIWLVSRPLMIFTWPVEIVARSFAPQLVEILPGISDREIRDIVRPVNGDPVIEEHERRLIERAFLLDQTTAYDIMTPRVDMVAWSEESTLAEVAAKLRVVRYSRIPLYSGSIDKITGVLYAKDAFKALISGQRDISLRALASEPFFVPGSLTLDKLLLDFQSRRIHMGIVIDEYGAVDGLIALEDILEELVGEIVDESDIAEEPIVRLGRGQILVSGSADLREINHFFNTTFPQLEHRSMNGYLLDILGRVPAPGERITEEGVLIEVTDATDTQVVQARLTRLTPRASSAGETG